MEIYVTLGCVVAATLMVGYVLRGVPSRLDRAKAGEVYSFTYLQPNTGVHKRHLVKVIDNYKLPEHTIERLNRQSDYRKNDKTFIRTDHLVTGKDKYGQIRNFYAERAIDCKKSWTGKLAYNFGIL